MKYIVKLYKENEELKEYEYITNEEKLESSLENKIDLFDKAHVHLSEEPYTKIAYYINNGHKLVCVDRDDNNHF